MMDKWTRRYLDLAKNISTWSKDPSKKIGAIAIGSKGQVLSQGFNGFARGIQDTPDRLNNRTEKYKYVVHGEMNCIYNACHNGISLDGAVLYVYGLPVCSECAKGVIQVGIKKVIMQYDDARPQWEESYKITQQMFTEAGIIGLRFDGNGKSIC
jgi:dCMP deaminase